MRCFLYALLLFAAPLVAQQTPVLEALQNGASYSTDIAAGSIFVLRGSNLSEDGFIQAAGLPLENSLNGVSIRFSPVAGGAPLDALMIYLYNVGGVNQLAGLLPSSAAPGDYDVAVTRNGRASSALRVSVVARNPGIVSADSSGSGPAQATTADYELIRFARGQLGGFGLRPVSPGDAVVLWVTGLGPDSLSDLSGETAGDVTAQAEVRVLVNGVEVVPFYAGRASGLPGTDQVNFILPADTSLGCDISIQLRAGGALSNRVTIAVAAAGAPACPSPQFTQQELETLSQGGTVRAAIFDINNILVENVFPGHGGATATTRNFFGGVVDYTQNDIVVEGFSIRPGECLAWTRSARAPDLQFGVVTYSGLDAGPAIAVSGPGIGQVSAGKLPGPGRMNEYFAELNGVGSGAYTLAAPGGADVGPFEATANLPEFDWTNRAATNSITRSGMTFTWTGGGDGWVNVTGYGARVLSGDVMTDYENAVLEGTFFSCIAEAADGSMTVGPSILSRLPAVPAGSPLTGSLNVRAYPGPARTVFQAPLTNGDAVRGWFGYSIGYAKILTVE